MEGGEVRGRSVDLVLSETTAVVSCVAMAMFYVATLHAPTLVFRLPPPSSFSHFMYRRFCAAALSSVASVAFSSFLLLLPIGGSWDLAELLSLYGIRGDHFWQAVVFPISLTSMMYVGSMIFKLLSWVDSLREHDIDWDNVLSMDYICCSIRALREWLVSRAYNVMTWRNFVVAPVTEELVFRACMLPLLLCGGFRKYTAIFMCPVFFSLAHLNHFMEIYFQQNCQLVKALMVIGLQLGYTVVFGSYASFLYLRTGHILAPLVAHVFCNYMGLPVLFSRRRGLVSLAFVMGLISFIWLLFPMTRPDLYNFQTSNCRCWQGFCSW
ncbi:hypothetical protein MLD38_018554 [Melastoma candidum]|uniref:Uncharacterized protein n=1 Tax=Melastoma candidum TaxID=119954 RepID=A0ACB9QU84_9MYRT|nr:hypothetical protein MLD38_018554 [Melastoma candidum]